MGVSEGVKAFIAAVLAAVLSLFLYTAAFAEETEAPFFVYDPAGVLSESDKSGI